MTNFSDLKFWENNLFEYLFPEKNTVRKHFNQIQNLIDFLEIKFLIVLCNIFYSSKGSSLSKTFIINTLKNPAAYQKKGSLRVQVSA